MSEPRAGKGKFIAYLVLLLLFAACALTTALLWWLGDWEKHNFGLKLSLRILWGCWMVSCLATILTRVTIFGWYFRRYLRWPGEAGKPAEPPLTPLPRRPATAPWYKSGKASFTITVVLVSLTGAMVVATAVMWMLADVTGEWVFWLVFKILWGSWWVLVIAAVLTRVAIFGWHMKKARDAGPEQPPPARNEEATDKVGAKS
jgi:hypothetical protein